MMILSQGRFGWSGQVKTGLRQEATLVDYSFQSIVVAPSPAVIHDVTPDVTYWYFLELLPPRWMHGDWFAFGEGAGPFRLFWKMHGQHVARELTAEETVLFCKLSRTSLHQ